MSNLDQTIDAKTIFRRELVCLGFEAQNHQKGVLDEVSLTGCQSSDIVRRHAPILLHKTIKQTVGGIHSVGGMRGASRHALCFLILVHLIFVKIGEN